MSLMQECARAEAAIRRAQSLFAASPAVAITGADALTQAATSAGDAGAAMGSQTGQSVTAHADLIGRSMPQLTGAARADASLQRLSASAAAVSQQGAAQLDTVLQQVKGTTALAATADTKSAKLAVLEALHTHVNHASDIVGAASRQDGRLSTDARNTKYDKATPGGGIQMVDDHSGGDTDPPHGQDPRYWIDVTKIIHVPDGQLAPSDTMQIGPNMYYPTPGTPGFVTPPPPPAKYPLDFGDIERTAPGTLPDYNHSTVAPGWAYPRPNPYNAEPPWPAPQRPIDIRDIITVPPGQPAPWGYSQYAPGWFAPDPARFAEH